MSQIEGVSGKREKSNQNIVMNKKFVQNIEMNAKIDPKVLIDVCRFKIGGRNHLQPSSPTSLDLFTDWNEPWLFIGNPNRDPFFVAQHLERHSASSDLPRKKLTSVREGLHVMVHCYMRQHFADRCWLRENPGGHAP